MLGGWELGVGSCRRSAMSDWRSSWSKRAKAAAIAGARLSADQRARAHAALARRGPASLRRHHRVRPAAGDGLLARPHPSRHLLLPPPRHRRHHQRKLRRRVDRAHHRAVRLRNRERLDNPRRPEGDAQLVRDMERGGPPASRSMARAAPRESRSPAPCGWPRATGNPCCRFTSRRRRTGACAAGIERRSRSRSARSHLWLASRSRWRRERRTTRSKSYGPTSSTDLSHSNSALTRYS